MQAILHRDDMFCPRSAIPLVPPNECGRSIFDCIRHLRDQNGGEDIMSELMGRSEGSIERILNRKLTFFIE